MESKNVSWASGTDHLASFDEIEISWRNTNNIQDLQALNMKNKCVYIYNYFTAWMRQSKHSYSNSKK